MTGTLLDAARPPLRKPSGAESDGSAPAAPLSAPPTRPAALAPGTSGVFLFDDPRAGAPADAHALPRAGRVRRGRVADRFVLTASSATPTATSPLVANGELERSARSCPSSPRRTSRSATGGFGHVFGDPQRAAAGARRCPPRATRGRSALERAFDRAGLTGSRAAAYVLFGHSAGAQFAHRLVALLGAAAARRRRRGASPPPHRVGRCVCANAGWYSMPTLPPAHAFPYGLGGLPRSTAAGPVAAVTAARCRRRRCGRHGRRAGGAVARAEPAAEDAVARAVAERFVRAPLLLLLGDRDTDPTKPRPEAFNSSAEAMAQGPHRLARGHAFLAEGRRAAAQLGVKCAWDLKVVPGVGHDGGVMTAVAVRLLFDPASTGEVDTRGLVEPGGAGRGSRSQT